MRNVIITETELELIQDVIEDWLRAHCLLYQGYKPRSDFHTVLGLRASLPQCNKDMVCEY